MKFSDEVRSIARARSRERCELCGTPILVAQFHHRRPRGMGGSRRVETGDASNCLVLHPACHAQVESDRKRALDNGWLVSQWKEPSDVPVKRWDGLFLLSADGSLIPA